MELKSFRTEFILSKLFFYSWMHNHRKSTVVLISIGLIVKWELEHYLFRQQWYRWSTVQLISNVSVYWWRLEVKLFCHWFSNICLQRQKNLIDDTNFQSFWDLFLVKREIILWLVKRHCLAYGDTRDKFGIVCVTTISLM